MSSQRFCLRWNNHQTNLLSVFDQLLHAGTFIDVTLVVEGQFLKAHKMVLSACSPYFQAIFVNHPEKHPIVILKDVPYNDMKCLLDFMYRGEVSVDQDRLAAFLRVAESLRIKGLTEVNDDKPPPPTASLTGGGCGTTTTTASTTTPTNINQNQPHQTNQLQQQLVAAASRNTQLAALQQSQQLHQQKQKSGQSMLLTNPLLGSALSQQKRKRGRPRKLSGSDTGGDGEYDGYESDSVVRGSPDVVEAKVEADAQSNSGDDNVISRSEDPAPDDSMDVECSPPAVNNNNNNSISKNASSNPAPSGHTTATSAKNASNTNATTNSTSNVKSSASSLKNENSMSELADNPEITIIPQVTKPASIAAPPTEPERSPMEADDAEDADDDEDDEERDDSDSELEFILPKYEASDDCTIVETTPPTEQDKDQQHSSPSSHQAQPNSKEQQQLFLHQLQQQHFQNLQLQRRSLAKMRLVQSRKGENGDSNGGLAVGSDPEDRDLGSPDTSVSHGRTPSQDSFEEPNGNNSHYAPSRQPARRRARRKNLSPDDQAEALTEMSVRGLNLFRYASINDGVYLCMECAKENIQKTFKNKYSFQRHAFLYHEGAQRKVFPCPVCNKEFSRPDKMKNHLKTTHESYMPKSDAVYPMSFMVGTEQGSQLPSNHNTTAKIESVLNAIQLQQHINLQKELHSQQTKFRLQQQLISPRLGDNGVPPITAVAASNSSQ
ncbi:protein tramtrack, alpha isoform isoform X2 [Topomyia yanbarensis]|uniref:protein tramtrack, alpha isoform isoform X2 n=1 Tax=Topomyia yanbarensis TaxID=2498891 RepID=UPI00273BE7BB|nr:protein tramtrack, alpha isoform isoform X2 [Topomyia yanbarensis]